MGFGALVDHTVSTEGFWGGECLGAHKALVGTLPSVAPHVACKDKGHMWEVLMECDAHQYV